MQYTSPDTGFNTTEKESHIIRTKASRLLNINGGPGATSIRTKRMLRHDITEFYEVLDVYGTLISIYYNQGKSSIVTREHQGESTFFFFFDRERVSTEENMWCSKSQGYGNASFAGSKLTTATFLPQGKHINEAIRVSKLSTSALVQPKQSQG